MIIHNCIIDEMCRNSRNMAATFSELENENGTPFDISSNDRRKTKRLCFEAVRYITNHRKLFETVINKQILPSVKEVSDGVPLNR